MIKTQSLFKKYFLILSAVMLTSAVAVSGVLLLISSNKIFAKNQIFIILSVFIFLILIIALVLYFMYKRISNTLVRMTKIVENIRDGEILNEISISGISELYQLELALNELCKAVQESRETNSKFASTVCHELRTPLTSISGFVDGILDGTISTDQQSYYLNLISQEIKRLSRMVGLMLNLERLESGECKPDMCNINVISIIVDILNTFEKKINEKGLNILNLNADIVTLFADKDMIYQVLYNLIENAIKFTPKNGYIEFNFRSDESYDYISIKNNGEGLSDNEKEKVFRRFYKTDSSRSSDTSGVGLGLNIVQSIISIHNGKINVDSVKDKYTQFTFSIPKSGI